MENLKERIEQYNARVNAHKQELSVATARMQVLEEQIQKECASLTSMLGREITVDNIEVECQKELDNISAALDNGEKILTKMEAQQNGVEEAVETVTTVMENVAPQTVAPQPVAPAPAPAPQPVEQPVVQPAPQPVEQTVTPQPAQGVFDNTILDI